MKLSESSKAILKALGIIISCIIIIPIEVVVLIQNFQLFYVIAAGLFFVILVILLLLLIKFKISKILMAVVLFLIVLNIFGIFYSDYSRNKKVNNFKYENLETAKKITNALENYQNISGFYPEKIEQLVPEYLDDLKNECKNRIKPGCVYNSYRQQDNNYIFSRCVEFGGLPCDDVVCLKYSSSKNEKDCRGECENLDEGWIFEKRYGFCM